jgi:hypothetical protein
MPQNSLKQKKNSADKPFHTVCDTFRQKFSTHQGICWNVVDKKIRFLVACHSIFSLIQMLMLTTLSGKMQCEMCSKPVDHSQILHKIQCKHTFCRQCAGIDLANRVSILLRDNRLFSQELGQQREFVKHLTSSKENA